jgi:Fe-S-cluster containining protein
MASRFERTRDRELRRLARNELRALAEGGGSDRGRDAALALESAFDAIAETAPGRARWECSAGCSFCCHMPVHVSAIEAVILAEHVRRSFDDDARERVIERLSATAAAIAQMNENEFKDSRTPCSLLADDGRCTVYEARPLACRGFHSTAVSVCEASYGSNDVRCDDARDRTTEEACARMIVAMHAVSDAAGLGTTRYELNSALARLLPEPAKDAATALAGTRGKPAPLDVSLAAVISRFRARRER